MDCEEEDRNVHQSSLHSYVHRMENFSSFSTIVIKNLKETASSLLETADVEETSLYDKLISVLHRHESQYANLVASLMLKILEDIEAFCALLRIKHMESAVFVHGVLQEVRNSVRNWFHSNHLTLTGGHPLLADPAWRPLYFLADDKKEAAILFMKLFIEKDQLPETDSLEFSEVRTFFMNRLHDMNSSASSRKAWKLLQSYNYRVEQHSDMMIVTSLEDNHLYVAHTVSNKLQIANLTQFQHDYLEQCKFITDDERHFQLRLIRRYPEGCSLANFIAKCCHEETRIVGHQILSYCWQIASGLTAIHNRNCVHGHISPQTIVMETDSHLRICGISNVLPFVEDESIIEVKKEEFDQRYCAPEVLNSPGFLSAASDSWSLGCVLFEMVTLKPKDQNEDHVTTLHQLRGTYSDEFLEDVISLLGKLWIEDDKDRMKPCELLEEKPLQGRCSTSFCPEPNHPTENMELSIPNGMSAVEEIGRGAFSTVHLTGPNTVSKVAKPGTERMLRKEKELALFLNNPFTPRPSAPDKAMYPSPRTFPSI